MLHPEIKQKKKYKRYKKYNYPVKNDYKPINMSTSTPDRRNRTMLPLNLYS